MFERRHHQYIAAVLQRLDARLLKDFSCLFGGGTAIALRYGEYRESVDMDFLISDLSGYRQLRQMLTGPEGMGAICLDHGQRLEVVDDIRADQYGIRTRVRMHDVVIKFEIVLEGRIAFDQPSSDDVICGVATLAVVDMAASKLLANSDRWADRGVFNRDAIDLAMMDLTLGQFKEAVGKAEAAYGGAVRRDLSKALDLLQGNPQWLERCMQAMGITVPRALLWKHLKLLAKRVAVGE